MAQLGIRLVNVALFVLTCFVTAGIFNRIVADRLAPESYTGALEQQTVESIKPSWEERKAILDRNLFGAKVAVVQRKTPPKKLAPPPPPVVKETKLPLKLLGTMSANPETLSTAVIMNTRTRKHEVVQVGDHIKEHEEAVVVSIEPRRVLLQNGAKREELILEESKLGVSKESGPQVAAKKPPARRNRRARRASRAKRATKAKQQEPNIPFQAAGLRGARELLSSARLLPDYSEDGTMQGVKVSSIKAGSFFETIGVEDNDVISSVNGIGVDAPEATSQVFQELGGAGPVDLILSRDGEEMTLTVTPEMMAERPGQ
jgi:general secretion pathway protein C